MTEQERKRDQEAEDRLAQKGDRDELYAHFCTDGRTHQGERCGGALLDYGARTICATHSRIRGIW